MHPTHHLGMRVLRGAACALLAGALLLVAPAAFAGEGERPGSNSDAGPVADDAPGPDGPGDRAASSPATDRVAATPAKERAKPFASDASDAARSSLPDSASQTAEAATSAPRDRGATSEAVLATTPADDESETVEGRPGGVPEALIAATEPVPLGDVNAAGTIDPAIRPTLQALTAAHQQPVTRPGIVIDPLVPISLGLLLLARALRRQPPPDDRTYSL